MNPVSTIYLEHGKNYGMLQQYLDLKQHDSIQVEYIWIGGSGSDIRSKVRTLKNSVNDIKDIPIWNYDGSHSLHFPSDGVLTVFVVHLVHVRYAQVPPPSKQMVTTLRFF